MTKSLRILVLLSYTSHLIDTPSHRMHVSMAERVGLTPTSETYGRLSPPRRNEVSLSSKRYMARDRPPQSSKVFPCVHGWHPCQNRSPWQPFVGFLPRLHVHRMVHHKHYASSTLTILSLYLLVKPSLVQILGDSHCIAARVDSYS